jgi:hypothetical protein
MPSEYRVLRHVGKDTVVSVPLNAADCVTERRSFVSRSSLDAKAFQPPEPSSPTRLQKAPLPTTCDRGLDKRIILKMILEI